MKIASKSITQAGSRLRTQEKSSTAWAELTLRQNECSRMDAILSTLQRVRKRGSFINRWKEGTLEQQPVLDPPLPAHTHTLREASFPFFPFKVPRSLPMEYISDPKRLHQGKCNPVSSLTLQRDPQNQWKSWMPKSGLIVGDTRPLLVSLGLTSGALKIGNNQNSFCSD